MHDFSTLRLGDVSETVEFQQFVFSLSILGEIAAGQQNRPLPAQFDRFSTNPGDRQSELTTAGFVRSTQAPPTFRNPEIATITAPRTTKTVSQVPI